METLVSDAGSNCDCTIKACGEKMGAVGFAISLFTLVLSFGRGDPLQFPEAGPSLRS